MSPSATGRRSKLRSLLVAGGGVGGLEAILAMRELSPRVRIGLLSPAAEFVLTPLAVAEPFGGGPPPRLSIEAFCAEQGVEWTRGELAEVWPAQRLVLTSAGTELPYDALLLAPGARRRDVTPGALSFRGGRQAGAVERLLGEAEADGGRVAFVVPTGPSWPLPLYELALLFSARLRGCDVHLELITPESSPLQVLGHSASERVRAILAEAAIEVHLEASGPAPAGRADADWVVSLPVLDVPEIPGLAQGSHGFIDTDAAMRVLGTERVWALGDASWFPAKQGGIAAQQADVAAADITSSVAGLDVEVPAFAPVLRVAMLTADGTHYMRSGGGSDGDQRSPLWWPPAKIAGRLLAPYLARRIDRGLAPSELLDMETDAGRDGDQPEALELILAGADLAADANEPQRALQWLAIADGLDLAVPGDYRTKQRRWQAQGGVAAPGALTPGPNGFSP